MRLVFYILVVVVIASSCTSSKKISYLQNAETLRDDSSLKPYEYKVKPGDILYIHIKGLENLYDDFFKQSSEGSGNMMFYAGAFYLYGYTVSDSGDIRIPVIGNIKVVDLTTNQIQSLIEEAAEQYLEETFISVKVTSYDINVFKEDGKAMRISLMKNNPTIFDVIASAGGISYYGNRKNVKIIRRTKYGHFSYSVDLTQKEILTTDQMYVQPDDIIVIEPVKMAVFRIQSQEYFTFLTTITSTITAVLLLITLTK